MKQLAIILISLIALCSCRSTKEVSNNTAASHDTIYEQSLRLDTIYLSKYTQDSVYFHDSVYVNQYQKGDTIYKDKYICNTKYKYRTKTDTIYKERIRHDTAYICRTDTIRTTVEKVTTKSSSFLDRAKGFISALLVFIIIYCGLYIYFKDVRKS